MNSIMDEVNKLKEDILNSKEYTDYKKYEDILDKNYEIKKIINEIKKVQQTIIKKEDKQEDTEKEKIELDSLYKKLNTYKDYTNYINSSIRLNELITGIQKQFENYFNKFII